MHIIHKTIQFVPHREHGVSRSVNVTLGNNFVLAQSYWTDANSLCGKMTEFMNFKTSSTLGCKVLMLSSAHTQQYTFPILVKKKKGHFQWPLSIT